MHARLISAASLVRLATTANAAHVPWTVYTDVRGFASTSNGATVSALGDVIFVNGAVAGTPTAFGVGGASGVWNAGPMVPGSTEVWATTLADAGIGRTSTSASASLNRGELKAVVDNLSIAPFGSSGSASARLIETIWFTNNSSGWLPVTLSMTVDGSISGSGSRADMFSFIGLSGVGGGCNFLAQCITPNLESPFAGYSVALYGDIDQMAAPGAKFGFRNQLDGKTNDDIPWWNFGFGAGHDPVGGLYDYSKTITLWVPQGETTLILDAWFRLTICNLNFRCDFGNTSALRFGDLPEGLSFTSQSGTFLTGLDNGGGGVIPEPATWGLMIAGFGLVGAGLRHRRAAPAAH